MAGNIRNQRTTHPRKAARRARAAERFSTMRMDGERASIRVNQGYRDRKLQEAHALGLSVVQCKEHGFYLPMRQA